MHDVTTVVTVLIFTDSGSMTMLFYRAHNKTMAGTDKQDNGGGDNKGSHKGFKYNRFSHNSSSIGIKATTDQIDRWREVDGT